MPKRIHRRTFRSAKHEVKEFVKSNEFLTLEKNPSYRLAFLDHDFLLREELRAVRLQLELLKPELIQQEHKITATVVVFGSARILEATRMEKSIAKLEEAAKLEPNNALIARQLKGAQGLRDKSHYYEEARRLGQLFACTKIGEDDVDMIVTTGGGPGIMEAANRGASEVGAQTLGLSVFLPSEEIPNEYVTPDLNFQFHYFAIRKMHFLMRARALIAFPGGFGTLDELFEALTLMQQKKIEHIPLVLMGREYWEKIINFEAMVDEGVIGPQDLNLFHYAQSAQEAYDIVMRYYNDEKNKL